MAASRHRDIRLFWSGQLISLLRTFGTLAQRLGVRAACLIGGGLGLLAVGGLVVHGRRVGLRWGVHPPTARLAHAVADRSQSR